jgi:hypothetical protein
MTQAPVVVFAFRRLACLSKTLAALEKCEGFSGTQVTIFSDGPRLGRDEEAAAVSRVREYLRSWTSRHGATLVEADENLGLRNSVVSGVSRVLKDQDRVIVLEDDIVVSPAFLTFMNQALEVCGERCDVYQISGYFIPVENRLEGVGLLRVPGCWGWGTWRRAWNCYENDAVALAARIQDPEDVKRFDIDGTYPYHESLCANAEGSADTWMVRWYASVFLRGGLTLYPAQSLTRNIGFEEDGTHCGPGMVGRVFQRQKIAARAPKVELDSLGDRESEILLSEMRRFYKWQSVQWGRPAAADVWRARFKRLLGRNWRPQRTE